MSQKLRAHADTRIRDGPAIRAAISYDPQKIHCRRDTAALFIVLDAVS